ncbi:methyltransferase-like protein 27 isoform X2 [Procambarus clarkii]|uniref:methyltransferase-like protein 27 isoform X2 n=1 Tax=Procambarus clarkii TaxID=6728 RepID=UPI0037442B3D
MSSTSEMEEITGKVLAEFRQPGQDPHQLIAKYDEWCKIYDKILVCTRYRGHVIAADYVAQMVPEDRRQHVRVMDIAAGTGGVGLKLHKKGFTNIDALDPSEGMLNILTETGVYSLIYQEFISQDPTTIPEDTYDVVVTSGSLAESHMPVQAIDEFIRITKPGGLVIIVTDVKYLTTVEAYKDKLEPHMECLEQQGLWHKELRTVVPNYDNTCDAVVYIYRVVRN